MVRLEPLLQRGDHRDDRLSVKFERPAKALFPCHRLEADEPVHRGGRDEVLASAQDAGGIQRPNVLGAERHQVGPGARVTFEQVERMDTPGRVDEHWHVARVRDLDDLLQRQRARGAVQVRRK